MKRVMMNILSNAVKYNRENGQIYISCMEIPSKQPEMTTMEFVCRDTGIGMTEEFQKCVFEPFAQEHTGSRTKFAGTGLGMPITKKLVEKMGGTITFESEEGVGTKFVVLIPFKIDMEADQRKEQENVSEKSIKGLHILLAEDNELNMEIAEFMLQNEGADVTKAWNGQEAVELFRKSKPGEFDVILMDIMMPVMDGIELCKRIKEDMRTSHIPVILLTAKDSLQDKEEGYASGADSYLTKPFSAKLLHSRINNLLETRKKIASLLALADIQPKQESAVSSLNKLDNEFLQKITQIIEENLEMEKMDIAFIADKMCMSHSTLYRKIKGLTDMSANEFIRKVKMRKGVELLMSGQYTISEIAYMIGFSSVAYFRQCFKDEYGMSPSDYVKQKQ